MLKKLDPHFQVIILKTQAKMKTLAYVRIVVIMVSLSYRCQVRRRSQIHQQLTNEALGFLPIAADVSGVCSQVRMRAWLPS